MNRAWISLRLPLKPVTYIFLLTWFHCRPLPAFRKFFSSLTRKINHQRGIRDSHKGSAIEFNTLSLNWVLKTWYPCMRCYQVIELLSLFRFHPVSNKPTKRTKKHAKMIFKFCDESCSLHVNKNQFSDYHSGWSVYISYLSCTIFLMV